MPELPPRELPHRSRPTQKTYRERVAKIIRRLKADNDLSNRDLADRIGCSDETISNAENERGDMKALLLLAIEHEFGAGTIDPVRELSNVRGVPIGAVCDSDPLPSLTAAVHKIAESRSPDSPGGEKTLRGEAMAMLAELRKAQASINWLIAFAEGDDEITARRRA